MDYAQTHFNTDAVRDICKACAICNAGTQIHTHTHSQYVCSSGRAIMLDPSYLYSFVPTYSAECTYICAHSHWPHKTCWIFAMHSFKHVDIHLHLHRVLLHWVQSEVFEVPSPQKVQATMLSLDRIMLPVLAKGKMKNSEPELQIWGKNGEWVHAVCSWGTKILENGGWKKHH